MPKGYGLNIHHANETGTTTVFVLLFYLFFIPRAGKAVAPQYIPRVNETGTTTGTFFSIPRTGKGVASDALPLFGLNGREPVQKQLKIDPRRGSNPGPSANEAATLPCAPRKLIERRVQPASMWGSPSSSARAATYMLFFEGRCRVAAFRLPLRGMGRGRIFAISRDADCGHGEFPRPAGSTWRRRPKGAASSPWRDAVGVRWG